MADYSTPVFSGDGSFSVETGYQAPAAAGTALLVFSQPERDVNGDGIADIGMNMIELYITVRDAITVGTAGEYTTLQEAIDAAKNGDVIVLIEEDDECPDSVIVPEGLEITIDLNGREIVFDGTAEITNYGKLTLMDSSEDYEGEVWHVVNAGGWSGAEHRKFLCRASNR